MDIKKLTIEEPKQKQKQIKPTNQIKNINYEKERKMRVETKTWGLTEDDLSYSTQISIIKKIGDENTEKNETILSYVSHIKTKICGYKQQDILKKKLDDIKFITFSEVLQLLKQCEMKCHYCSQEVYILYERVREMKQWSLDRINNDLGHNSGNVLIACLECNLKRRRTNKDAFMFTKNMVITREGI
jgi:hypothetical protein